MTSLAVVYNTQEINRTARDLNLPIAATDDYVVYNISCQHRGCHTGNHFRSGTAEIPLQQSQRTVGSSTKALVANNKIIFSGFSAPMHQIRAIFVV